MTNMRRISGYTRAESVDDALALTAESGGDAMFLAGGQSLVSTMKQRLVADGLSVIDIGHLSELSYVEEDGDRMRIGATTTHADLVDSALLADRVPAFPEMVEQIGDVQIRNMGTIGGDVVQADPSADYPVLLAALDAGFEARSESGSRTMPADEFFLGYFETALEPGELLTEVSFDVPSSNAAAGFSKFAKRKGDFPVVNAAARLAVEDGACTDATVFLGCLQGAPVASAEAADALVGTDLDDVDPAEVGATAADSVAIDPDEQASTAYKRRLAAAVAEDAVTDCVARLDD